jgi:hypothetical protein
MYVEFQAMMFVAQYLSALDPSIYIYIYAEQQKLYLSFHELTNGLLHELVFEGTIKEYFQKSRKRGFRN